MTAVEPQSDSLFSAVSEMGAYGGRRVTVTMHRDPEPVRRGPGRPRTARGPADATAPAYWTAGAEATILALVAAGHKVSTDDLHERFPHEPSASGAAFGALFQRLAGRGQLVEVGMVKSARPEARRRRVILWGAP